MHPSLPIKGYEIHRAIISKEEVAELRRKADAVPELAGSSCGRHLRKRSR